MVDPGLVPVSLWRPDPGSDAAAVDVATARSRASRSDANPPRPGTARPREVNGTFARTFLHAKVPFAHGRAAGRAFGHRPRTSSAASAPAQTCASQPWTRAASTFSGLSSKNTTSLGSVPYTESACA